MGSTWPGCAQANDTCLHSSGSEADTSGRVERNSSDPDTATCVEYAKTVPGYHTCLWRFYAVLRMWETRSRSLLLDSIQMSLWYYSLRVTWLLEACSPDKIVKFYWFSFLFVVLIMLIKLYGIGILALFALDPLPVWGLITNHRNVA